MRAVRKKQLSVLGTVTAMAVSVAAFTPVGSAVAGASGHNDTTVLEAELTGDAEVGDGDSDGEGEAFVFSTNRHRRLCYVLTVEKIDTATAAHIHEAPEGENGDVVVTLGTPDDGNSAGCLRQRGKAWRMLVKDIINHPEEYYINVHNDDYPDGAIRGQLEEED